jgi:hypothetical protein
MTKLAQLAAQARRVRLATERRDELIRELRADGIALRTVAEFAELSHTAVAKIAARPAR